jgi:hypothetical protein
VTDLLRILLALAAIGAVSVFIAAIVSPRWADRYERLGLGIRHVLRADGGFFRLGEPAVFLEGDAGGGGGDGGAGEAGEGGSGNGGGGNEGGQLLADAQAAIKALTDAGTQIPEALTKAVNELKQARQDAGRYRSEKNESTAEVKALQKQMNDIAKHLGIEGSATPEEIAAKLTEERDNLAAENRSLKVSQALAKTAKTKGADEDALLDSRSFMTEVDKLDPSKDTFTKALEDLVDKAVKDNPKLKAQAARSGNDLSGGGSAGNGNGQRPSLEDAVSARLAS